MSRGTGNIRVGWSGKLEEKERWKRIDRVFFITYYKLLWQEFREEGKLDVAV